jgi:hypothetical protein
VEGIKRRIIQRLSGNSPEVRGQRVDEFWDRAFCEHLKHFSIYMAGYDFGPGEFSTQVFVPFILRANEKSTFSMAVRRSLPSTDAISIASHLPDRGWLIRFIIKEELRGKRDSQ